MIRTAAFVAVVCSACWTSPTSVPAPGRWTYRLYGSAVEPDNESVDTYLLDEAAGTMTRTSRLRRGRDPVSWTDATTDRWTLTITRDPALHLMLASEAGRNRYACATRTLDVAPWTAVRKDGHWSEPTRPLVVQVCTETGKGTTGPSRLFLAPEPIELLQADRTCCDQTPVVRFIPADGRVMPPRDPTFQW